MVDWPPEHVVVYHDNAPEQKEPSYRRGEYAVNTEMARRSGWPMLPDAGRLMSGVTAVLNRVDLTSVSALGWRINAIYVRLGSIGSMRVVCHPYDRIVSLTPIGAHSVFVMNCVELGGQQARFVILVLALNGTWSGSVYGNADPGDLGRLVVTFTNPTELYASLG
jgi:hypothetical protein